MGYQPIAPIPLPPTKLQRYERELRRERTSDVVTEWLNFAGLVLFAALLANLAVLAWMAA